MIKLAEPTYELQDGLSIISLEGIYLSQIVLVFFIYSPPLRELLMELGPMSDRIINQIPEPFSCLSLHGMGQYSGKETILLYRKIVCATSEGNNMVLNREVVLSIEMGKYV